MKKILNILCRVLQAWHSAKRFLCRVPILTLGKVFFLFLFSNFFCGIYTVPWSTCSNLKLFYDLLVYFLIFYVYLNFRHRTSQLAQKLLNFLSQPLHAMTRHLDKFRDFWTSFAFYIIKKHFFNKLVVMFRETDVRNFTNVPAHGLKIHSKTWIPFFESLNSNISCTCSSNLLFREKIK